MYIFLFAGGDVAAENEDDGDDDLFGTKDLLRKAVRQGPSTTAASHSSHKSIPGVEKKRPLKKIVDDDDEQDGIF